MLSAAKEEELRAERDLWASANDLPSVAPPSVAPPPAVGTSSSASSSAAPNASSSAAASAASAACAPSVIADSAAVRLPTASAGAAGVQYTLRAHDQPLSALLHQVTGRQKADCVAAVFAAEVPPIRYDEAHVRKAMQFLVPEL